MGLVYAVRALGLITLLSCCATRDASTAAQEDGDGAASVTALYGDFIAALKRRHWSGADGPEKCVLEPETTVDSLADERDRSWDELRAGLPGLERGTYDSFWSENGRARPVAPLDRGAMKQQVMTKEVYAQLKAILRDEFQTEDYWEVFRNQYGEAVRIGLSAPGFSKDRRQALIYYEAGFGWLGEWGCYCLLKREGDRWEIAEEDSAWES